MLTNTSNSVEENGEKSLSNHNASAKEAKPAHGSHSKTSGASASTEKAKSAAAEIVVLHPAAKPDPVGDMIERCKAVAKGGSVFKAANAHIFEGLEVAYPTFLLIKDNKVEHQRVIDALMTKGGRERMPSLNKPAYNATVLTCHLENPEEWTLCSDWANVVLADIENVSPDAFPTWVQDKKIGESKRNVRDFKKAGKPLKIPFTEGDFPALAYVFKHCDDERMRRLMMEELTTLDGQLEKALATMKVATTYGHPQHRTTPRAASPGLLQLFSEPTPLRWAEPQVGENTWLITLPCSTSNTL